MNCVLEYVCVLLKTPMNKFNFKNISSALRNNPTIKMVQPSADDQVKIDEEDDGSSHSKRLDFAFIYRPVYYCSRIFGLMPFSIDYDSNGAVRGPRVRTLDCLWFITAICLYIYFAIKSYRSIILPKKHDSSVYLIILSDYLLLILGLLVGAIIICMDMYNRFKIVEIMELFNTFDREV